MQTKLNLKIFIEFKKIKVIRNFKQTNNAIKK